MNMGLGEHRRLLRGMALTVSVLLVEICGGAEVTVRGRITQEVQDGVYVDTGTEQGLRAGLTGVLHLDDGRTYAFEVLSTGEQAALLRLVGYPGREGLAGRLVDIAFGREAKTPEKPKDPNGVAEASRLSPGRDGQSEFVPLLAPLPRESEAPRPHASSHGRVQVRQTFQTDARGDLGYAVTRVDSSGRVDRIGGTPWSFEWSGDLRYRAGDAFASHPDAREPHPDIYRAMFQRPFGEEGFLRLGRFVPYELPGIGYVDGLQGQVHPGERTRFGIVGGLKPNRINLDASADEPLLVPYATFASGPRDGRHYFGTVGLLNSYYRGDLDRLALLFDQRAGWGKALTLYSTAILDFDVGASEIRQGTRLTQLDVSAVSELSSFLTLRAGVDHWERPDHQAQNVLLPFRDERFFDQGYWRYWVGSSQNLPWNLRLYEEVGYLSSDTVSGGVRGQVSLTRSGLGDWRDASATVSVYNLVAYEDGGYGCQVSAYLPLRQGAVALRPAAGFRLLQGDSTASGLSLTYLSLGLDGRLSRNWSVFGDFTYFTGDNAEATLFELGLRFAW